MFIFLYVHSIRSINSSPVDKNILTTCYNKGKQKNNNNKVQISSYSFFLGSKIINLSTLTNILPFFHFPVSDNKAEIKAAIWRIPPVDETEPPPPDSPGLSHSSSGGYTRPLQLVCELDNQNENMKRLVEMKSSSL